MLRGPSDVEVRRRAASPESAGCGVVRVRASGICGTDVEIYRGHVPVPAGRVLGHEAAGVVELAPAGSALEPGTPVVVDPTIACGGCPPCLAGLPNLCARGGLLGRELDGVFADEMAVPAANLHPLPETVALEDAPLLQVLATVVHAQEPLGVEPGQLVAVVGLGCTGQLHAQLLASRGARVLGVTRSPEKRALASTLACSWTAAPDQAPAAVEELDPGGADVVVECAGTLEALDLALRLVRPGGTILGYGIQTAGEGRLDLYQLYRKELRLLGSRASRPHDMQAAVALAASGRVRLAPLITHRLPLDAARDALELAAGAALKVVMEHG